jgi:hemolysin activation/secretion protein
VSKAAKYHASAIWAIDEQLRKRFTDDPKLHLLGVYVVPSPNDFVEVGEQNDKHLVDKRGDRTDATLWVFTGKVTQVRTIASGKRITDPSARTDNDLHKWIRVHSPVQPAATQPVAAGAKPAERPDLLRKDELDDYVSFLNRQPGRHVDVAISGVQTGSSGDVSLDYLVTETRPWSAYFQISNTGTKETDPWRERFGYVNNQLFKRDDTLSVDYTTAAFNTSQDVALSYDTPISPNRRLRARVYGDYDQFTASDVGVALERFNGEQYSGGAELVYNFFQRGNAFVDAVAGARYEHVFVRNTTADVNTSGSADFAVPYVGLRYDQITDIASTTADVTLLGRFTNASLAERNKLGRLNTNQDVLVLQGGLAESFYLEPIFDPRFYAGQSTLAHEVALSVRGQYAFNGRLIPQAEDVAGGLYSVRGYPESVSAGDSVVIASAEYRFHIPRSFTPADVRAAQAAARKKSESAKQPLLPPGQSAPAPSTGAPSNVANRPSASSNLAATQFRWIPQQAYGRPDWDLIARAFVDAGFTFNSSKQAFEHNDTLVGTGLGLELDVQLQHLQNLSVRADWGVPLNALPGGPSVGDSRFHISATIMY